MMRAVLLAAMVAGCEQDRPPVDVFFIAVDTLRVDHVGAYNPTSAVATPHIDVLARDSIRFDDAFTPISVTGPAFASVMTARGPTNHGVMVNLFRNGNALDASQLTVAERFSEAGYRTAAFVSAFTLRRALGLDQGFDVYNSAGHTNREGAVTAAVFGSWLGVTTGPVFAWVHAFDSHGPFKRHLQDGDLHSGLEAEAPMLAYIPQYQQIDGYTDPKLFEALYARGVGVADAAVGQIVAAIKATGRYDDALIIFFSDHGEGFRERDLWYDHGAFPHVEQTQVPLLVKLPRSLKAGSIDKRLVSLMDIAPTALEVAALPALPMAEGVSLRTRGVIHPMLEAESSHCKRIGVLSCAPHGGEGKIVAVRTQTLSLVSEPRGAADKETQYNRLTDAKEWMGEQRVAQGAEFLALKALRAERRGRHYPPLPELGSAGVETAQLQALGYVE